MEHRPLRFLYRPAFIQAQPLSPFRALNGTEVITSTDRNELKPRAEGSPVAATTVCEIGRFVVPNFHDGYKKGYKIALVASGLQTKGPA
jgi:hypothetical protein